MAAAHHEKLLAYSWSICIHKEDMQGRQERQGDKQRELDRYMGNVR